MAGRDLASSLKKFSLTDENVDIDSTYTYLLDNFPQVNVLPIILDVQEMDVWCIENLGDEFIRMGIFYFFLNEESRTLFALRWS